MDNVRGVLFLALFFSIFKIYFGRQNNRKGWTDFPTCWIIPQMSTTARAGLDQNFIWNSHRRGRDSSAWSVSWCPAGCTQQEAGTEAEQPGLSDSLFSQWHKARPLRFLKVLFTWSHRDRVRGRRKRGERFRENSHHLVHVPKACHGRLRQKMEGQELNASPS